MARWPRIASWVLLVPTIAILLPRYGVEGVALALAISWFASLLLLIGLVLASGSRWFAAGGPGTPRNLPVVPVSSASLSSDP